MFPTRSSRARHGVVALAAALLFTGCATLLNSEQRTVSFSSIPAEAEIWIGGTYRGTTPFSLELNNHANHRVLFRKEGYREVSCDITATVGAKWVILDVLAGLVPVIVDAATGEWRSLDRETCNVTLPVAGPGRRGPMSATGM